MNKQPDVSKLIESLAQKTRDRKIQWEPTAIENRFITTIGGKYSILVEKTKGLYRLSIEDLEKGSTQEIVSDFNEQVQFARELEGLFREIWTIDALEFQLTVNGLLEELNQL